MIFYRVDQFEHFGSSVQVLPLLFSIRSGYRDGGSSGNAWTGSNSSIYSLAFRVSVDYCPLAIFPLLCLIRPPSYILQTGTFFKKLSPIHFSDVSRQKEYPDSPVKISYITNPQRRRLISSTNSLPDFHKFHSKGYQTLVLPARLSA